VHANIRRFLLAFAFAIATAIAQPSPSQARDDGWIPLGTGAAAADLDRDGINVGPNNGRFDSLRFEVRDNDVYIKEVNITSYEGAEQTFRIDKVVREGGGVGPIELRGRLQSVRDITLIYQTTGPRAGARRGSVTVLGSRSGREPGYSDRRDDGARDRADRDRDRDRLEFESIDRRTVDRRAEEVVFTTERGEGRLSHIRLRAGRDPVRVRTVTVVFANGERQSVELQQRLDAGESTAPIAVELNRDRRRIDRVVVERRPSFRSSDVELELLGARARPGRDDDERRHGGEAFSGAPRDGWVLFGTQNVGFGIDRDVIKIGRDAGQFEKIALRVLKNDIYLRELTIVFGNGQRQRVSVNVELKEGFRTAPLPLDGGDRFIDEIELVYQSKPDRRGQAIVEIWGDYSERWLRNADARRERSGGWVLLGAQRAEMLNNDRDTIEVGQRFGRMSAIRLAVKRRSVRINGVRVVYGNGETEDIPIGRELSEGQSTDPIDLRGRGRIIERIELSYRSKLTFKGEGVVEVWGLQ
jgi:hypothetical protein